MSYTADVNSYFLTPNHTYPLILDSPNKSLDPFTWLEENKSNIENDLIRYGAILLRNFNIQSISEFNRFVQILCPNLLDYIYRSTPRTKLGGKIYTATEYPAHRIIPMHNENSYAKLWPQKIFFYSSIVAEEGGETPIADSRAVYQKIAPIIREKFEQHGVMYVRNYSDDIDLRWQDVFQTESKQDVEKYCVEHDLDFRWHTGNPELTTKQICQATLIHPITSEPVWFNQAHLFHVSALDQDTKQSLLDSLGEQNIPRNAFYGDHSPIELDVLAHIREIYDQEKVKFIWQKNDIMILDNILVAHGRETYTGERKIAVAMS